MVMPRGSRVASNHSERLYEIESCGRKESNMKKVEVRYEVMDMIELETLEGEHVTISDMLAGCVAVTVDNHLTFVVPRRRLVSVRQVTGGQS